MFPASCLPFLTHLNYSILARNKINCISPETFFLLLNLVDKLFYNTTHDGLIWNMKEF